MSNLKARYAASEKKYLAREPTDTQLDTAPKPRTDCAERDRSRRRSAQGPQRAQPEPHENKRPKERRSLYASKPRASRCANKLQSNRLRVIVRRPVERSGCALKMDITDALSQWRRSKSGSAIGEVQPVIEAINLSCWTTSRSEENAMTVTQFRNRSERIVLAKVRQ